MSWIVTKEPEVILRLRTEFQSSSIVSMRQFVRELTSLPTPCFEPSEKTLFLKKWQDTNPKPMWDEEDAMSWAVEHITQVPKKVLFLLHDYSELEGKFIQKLGAIGAEVSILQTSGAVSVPKYHVCETHNARDQILSVAKEIKTLHNKGIRYQDMFVFLTSLDSFSSEISLLFSRERIPFSLWKIEGQIDAVSVLPLSLNTMVFGQAKAVWICCSEVKRCYPEDRHSHVIPRPKAEGSLLEYQEKLRSALRWQMSESKRTTLLYTKEPSLFLRCFLEDNEEYRFHRHIEKTSARHFQGKWLANSQNDPWVVPQPQLQHILPSVYSARSLGQFQKCPYGFFVKECLRIKPLKTASLELAPDEEGSLMHDVLYRYFKGGQTGNLEDAIADARSQFREKNKKIIQESDLNRVRQSLYYFIDREKEWQKQSHFTPTYFELPFEMELQHIKIRGKIDRVDVDRGTQSFKIIDYKTGTSVPTQKDILAGKEIQLLVYAMAVQELFLPKYIPEEAVFYLIKEAQRKKGFYCESEHDWRGLKERAVETIFQILSSIEQGTFPKTPEHCFTLCDLKSHCENK